MYSFEEINQLRKDEFVKVFGNVVEHYPSCAVYLYQKKPFSNVQQLIDGVSEFLVVKLSLQDRERVLNLHPDLAGRLYRQSLLTKESVEEQKSSGLDELTEPEVEELKQLNSKYKGKFDFPFVICARENKAATILAGLKIRMNNSKAQEIDTAIAEVKKISAHRIMQIVKC